MISLLDRVRFCLLSSMIAIVVSAPLLATADEVVLDSSGSSVTLGDFECSPCRGHVARPVELLRSDCLGEVTAGQLWTELHSHGIEHLETLTLYLDIQKMDKDSAFDMQSFELTITDGNKTITAGSSGGKTFVVPANRFSSAQPEAKLEIPLNYDFMERFSADSQEKVNLAFKSNNVHADSVRVVIPADSNMFSKSNFILLFGFVGFWGFVFVLLNRMTRPDGSDPKSAAGLNQIAELENERSKQALSA